MKRRITNPKSRDAKRYYGMELCDRDTFIYYFLTDENFIRIYSAWPDTGYAFGDAPTVDRIDNERGYSMDNIQFLTHRDNTLKDMVRKPILMFDKQGNFIKEYTCKWRASLELGIPNGNICKAVYGIRKSAGGYKFQFKNESDRNPNKGLYKKKP
jgi:hypothetical protein